MNKTAVITGAGSGVGRSTAIALFQAGWKVAILGRREESLRETCRHADPASTGEWLVCPCDIGVLSAVQQMASTVLAKFQTVEVLVNAAGTNIPNRSLEVLSLDDYHLLINSNLNGPYYCVQSFLPGMRQRRSGTIINIGSEAGVQASPKSGPAYVMSKFGLRGLTQSINAEERLHGIRACSILPGDIDTPLLDKRSSPPPAEARKTMLHPDDIAACALFAINAPARVWIEEILVRPR